MEGVKNIDSFLNINVTKVLVESLYDECVFLTFEASPSKEFGGAIYFYNSRGKCLFVFSGLSFDPSFIVCNFTACKPSVDHHALHGNNILLVLIMQN